MVCHRIVNSVQASNTYVFHHEKEGNAWVVDPGDFEPIIPILEKAGRTLGGILVTHSHHDHIYGINALQEIFPGASIHVADRSVEGLFSAKHNMSRYYLRPFCVKSQNVVCIRDGSLVPLAAGLAIRGIETPGHHPGALCFSVGDDLFTGDSLIPGSKITTVLPGGDRRQARESVTRLIALFHGNTRVHPGHGDECTLGAVDINIMFPLRAGVGEARQ